MRSLYSLLVVIFAAVGIAACAAGSGGTVAAELVGSSPSLSPPPPSPSPSPAPSSSERAGSSVFISVRHHYTLTLPPMWAVSEIPGQWSSGAMQDGFALDTLERIGVAPSQEVRISSQLLEEGASFADWLIAYTAAFERQFPCEKSSEREGDVAGYSGRYMTWFCSTGQGTRWIAEEALVFQGGRAYVIRVDGPDRSELGGPSHTAVLDDWIGRMTLNGGD